MKRVLVIGGGPAGMMAAISAAAAGAKTTLLEKKPEVGKKLSITGKGRCNLTNSLPIEDFIAQYPGNGRFLYSALNQFSNIDLMNFFAERGVKTKIERGQRVFPASDRAGDIVAALYDSMLHYGVEVIKLCLVKDLLIKEHLIKAVITDRGTIAAEAFIVATGGLSYPATGSSGDGYTWAARAGHHIVDPKPGLVPLEAAENWVSQLQGLSLKNVQATAYNDKGKVINQECGELLFTHFGVSGPIVLTMSSDISAALSDEQRVRLVIDLKPALSAEKLDERLQRDFDLYSRKQFKNSLDDLLPRLLIPVMVSLSGIDTHKYTHQVTRAERLRLVELLKNLTVTITGTRPIKEAIITRGGIDVTQLDPRSMQSKFVANLYFCGEILDVDGYTGGFNLQAAFSTGYVAGKAAART